MYISLIQVELGLLQYVVHLQKLLLELVLHQVMLVELLLLALHHNIKIFDKLKNF